MLFAGSQSLLSRRLLCLILLILLSSLAACNSTRRNLTLVETADVTGAPAGAGQATEVAEPDEEPEQLLPIYVHVSGAVAEPGVYILLSGQRACDALEAAGGPTADAVLEAVNLAAHLADAQHLHIPGRAEWERALSGAAAGWPQTSPPSQPAGATLVDINKAAGAALQTLPGIGPVLASRIIVYRAANGPFTTVDELINVSGIGPSRLEDIRPLVTVGRIR